MEVLEDISVLAVRAFRAFRAVAVVLTVSVVVAVLTVSAVSCGTKEPKPTIEDPDTTPTQISYDHRSINSKDGRQKYRMETPLLKRYELASEPFTEFPEGIKVELFGDSTLSVESDIRADYAHLNEATELWTARGHVVANNYAGQRRLVTERLYWDQKTKKIYSDTLTMVVDRGNRHVGSNFEADETFETWTFHNTTGQIEVESPAAPVAADSSASSDSSASPASPVSSKSPVSVESVQPE